MKNIFSNHQVDQPNGMVFRQVDFTPDDDDGFDVELPAEDAAEDDVQSFDADDLEPPGDEDG